MSVDNSYNMLNVLKCTRVQFFFSKIKVATLLPVTLVFC